ncbi:MAG: hypothetical protein ABI488_04430 [Polyangiaceae bacterium]
MRPVAKPAAIEAGPSSEPALRVLKPRRRRLPAKAESESSAGGSLKPLLIGVGVGSALVLLASAIQANSRQGAQVRAQSQPSLWNALAKTAALGVARMVAKRVGRDLAERALPALAGRAIVALSARAVSAASV